MFRRDLSSALALTTLLFLAGCTAGVSPTTQATASTEAGSLEQGVTVTIIEVTDGDTMDIRFDNGTAETVRLLGVDTPEVYAENTPSEWEAVPDTQAGEDWLRQWGTTASEFATNELDGERVEIRVDPQADRRGGYGRLLVYVSRPDSGRSFNQQLLERGYARLYETPFSERDAFAAAEADAREAGRGVWGFEDGSEPLDVSGWTISDAAGHTDTVPDGVQLHPAARVRPVTRPGTDTDTTLYWGEDQALWNNGGDTVTVRTASGERVTIGMFRFPVPR